MKRNARASVIRRLELSWQVVVEIKRSGFGKVRYYWAFFSSLHSSLFLKVHPDGDFETISVLMEHTQDVKCVAWHPTEEVRPSLPVIHYTHSSDRFSRLHLMTTLSNSTSKTPQTTGSASPPSPDTVPPSGPSRGLPPSTPRNSAQAQHTDPVPRTRIHIWLPRAIWRRRATTRRCASGSASRSINGSACLSLAAMNGVCTA
jgi:hypothetical protein